MAMQRTCHCIMLRFFGSGTEWPPHSWLNAQARFPEPMNGQMLKHRCLV